MKDNEKLQEALRRVVEILESRKHTFYDLVLRRIIEEALAVAKGVMDDPAAAHEISFAAFDTDDIGNADRGGEERG